MKNKHFQLIVISAPDGLYEEAEQVNEMFRLGLQKFHLRKPRFSTRKLSAYLKLLDAEFLERVVIHSHHELSLRFPLGGIYLSRRHKRPSSWKQRLLRTYLRLRRPELTWSTGMHALSDLLQEKNSYSYVFLGPIYESISKVGYKGSFSEQALREVLAKVSIPVMALGGVTEDYLASAYNLGFSGVAVLGRVWQSEDAIETFKMLHQRCQQIDAT